MGHSRFRRHNIILYCSQFLAPCVALLHDLRPWLRRSCLVEYDACRGPVCRTFFGRADLYPSERGPRRRRQGQFILLGRFRRKFRRGFWRRRKLRRRRRVRGLVKPGTIALFALLCVIQLASFFVTIHISRFTFHSLFDHSRSFVPWPEASF